MGLFRGVHVECCTALGFLNKWGIDMAQRVLVDPTEIHGIAKSGETFTQDFFVRAVPNGKLVARLDPPVHGIRLTMKAMRKVLIEIPPDEIPELPPNMRPPHGHLPAGYVEYQTVGTVGDGETLAVTPDLLVQGFLEFTAPATPKFAFATTKMMVEGFDRAKVAEVPVDWIVGELMLELPRRKIRGIIGVTTTFKIVVRLPETVPATQLTFTSQDPFVSIGGSITLEGGRTAEVTLSLSISSAADVGSLDASIRVDGLSLSPRYFPITIDVVKAERPEPTQAEIDANFRRIDQYWRSQGGFRGPIGFPLAPPKFLNGVSSRVFAGGTIQLMNEVISTEERYYARVRYVGCGCLEESSELSASDEPYFIIGVASANGSNTMRFGPYEDVDAGDSRFEAADIVTHMHKLAPPIMIGVVAIEHDEGTPEEAESKVRKVVQDIVEKFEQAAGSFTGADTGSFVIPGWARDILIGWIPEGIAAIFGMGDDLIGKNTVVLFDDGRKLASREQYPVLGKFGQNEYTHVIHVGEDDGEGKYDLYVKVDLFRDHPPDPV